MPMQNALSGNDVNKDGRPIKCQFENSWGDSAGHKGCLTFTDKWFDEYMFRIVIHKDFDTPEVIELYNTEASLLPPWDWMF